MSGPISGTVYVLKYVRKILTLWLVEEPLQFNYLKSAVFKLPKIQNHFISFLLPQNTYPCPKNRWRVRQHSKLRTASRTTLPLPPISLHNPWWLNMKQFENNCVKVRFVFILLLELCKYFSLRMPIEPSFLVIQQCHAKKCEQWFQSIKSEGVCVCVCVNGANLLGKKVRFYIVTFQCRAIL